MQNAAGGVEACNFQSQKGSWHETEITISFSFIRKGAPFLRSIDAAKQRLLEAGLVNYWLNDLIEASARKARMERKAEGRQVQVSRGGKGGRGKVGIGT